MSPLDMVGAVEAPPLTPSDLERTLIGGDDPTEALAPDLHEAREDQARQAAVFAASWVKDWSPDWWFNICAIPTNDGPPTGRSWKADEVDSKALEIASFILRYNGPDRRCGIYMTVNPLSERVEGKPGRNQVAAYVALHLDVDPAVGDGQDYAAAKAELWASLAQAIRDEVLTPTVAIDSGNGAGLFFHLAEPEPDLTQGNRACATFQANARLLLPSAKVDSTADAARLMRLPHVLNWPNASKLARGYPAVPSWSTVRGTREHPRIAPEQVEALATQAPEHVGVDRAAVPQEQHRAPSAERLVALVEAMPDTGEDVDYHEAILTVRAIRAAATGVLDDDGWTLAQTRNERCGHPQIAAKFDSYWRSISGPSAVGWTYLVDKAKEGGSDVASMESCVLDFAEMAAEIDRAKAANDAAEAERQKGRFRLLTMADCVASEARQYVLKGTVAYGDLAILFGPPGAGKSALAPYLAHGVSSGRAVFGRKVRPCRVLYIAAEDGHGMKGRMRALRAEHGDAPGFYLIADVVDLGKPADVAAIQARIAECDPGLIFVDTLAAAFPGLKENESEDMGRAVAVLRSLSQPTGAAVVVLHHGTKGNDRGPRGHSLLNGAADVTLEVGAPVPGKPERVVTFGKNRNGPADGMAWHFAVRGDPIGHDVDGDVETAAIAFEVAPGTWAPKLSKQQQNALAALHEVMKAKGVALPTGDGYPDKATVGVEVTAWRKECDRCGLSDAGKPEDRTKAFTRAKDGLRCANLVAARDEWVWPIR